MEHTSVAIIFREEFDVNGEHYPRKFERAVIQKPDEDYSDFCKRAHGVLATFKSRHSYHDCVIQRDEA